ncbi:MAG: hypothetical protein GY704_12240, partial [Phycisphaeraceae bacterium]|nr:hypothetical protein [Phycisphaeraceae bacterium]
MEMLHVSKDDETILVGSRDGSVRRFELLTGEEVGVWSGDPPLAFSDDGARVALAPAPGGVEIRDARTGRSVVRARGRAVPIRSLSFTSDGGAMLLGLEDGAGLIRSLKADGEARLSGPSSEASTAVAAVESEDGVWLVIGAEDGMVRFERPQEGESGGAIRTAGMGEIVAIAPAPARRMIITACADGSVWAWDLGKAERIQRFRLRPGTVTDLAISPDEGRLAVTVGRRV